MYDSLNGGMLSRFPTPGTSLRVWMTFLLVAKKKSIKILATNARLGAAVKARKMAALAQKSRAIF